MAEGFAPLELRDRAVRFVGERGAATQDEVLTHVYGGPAPAALSQISTNRLFGLPAWRSSPLVRRLDALASCAFQRCTSRLARWQSGST